MGYQEKINRYCKNLIKNGNEFIKKQITYSDLENFNSGISDPTFESEYVIYPNIIYKYGSRIVVFFNDECFCNCRFCFRKGRKYYSQISYLETLDNIKNLLKENKQIKELIISGGDFFTLKFKIIKEIIEYLSDLDVVIRIHTRVLSFNPISLTNEVVKLLKNLNSLWFVTHFNHFEEIAHEIVLDKIKLLKSNSIPIMNQSVLLKGVNDLEYTLEILFFQLYKLGIKPYYLHSLDPAPGTSHFNVPIKRGIELMEYLAKKLPGGAVPRYVKDGENRDYKKILF